MLNFKFDESPASAPLPDAIAQALAAIPERLTALAVAISGGADSAMLGVHAAVYARQHGIDLHFFHIHHGLQADADAWQAQVHDLAYLLAVPCHSLRVSVAIARGEGIESAARTARYTGLAQLANRIGVRHIMLAHHRDDQAETVMLRLLRGTGPGGLAAMARVSERQGIIYLRPWLDIERAQILSRAAAFSTATGWQPVHDPTNADDKYTRAALRERLVPELNQRWPGWQGNVVRHARLSAQTREVLGEVAAQDFNQLDAAADSRSFSLKAWRGLSTARQALVLRHWLSLFCRQLPSDARLQDIMRQLCGLHAMGHDRQMQVRHGALCVRCIKGRVMLDAVLDEGGEPNPSDDQPLVP